MTLEIKSTISIKNKEKQDVQFSPEQLEILKEEYSKKLVNEEIKDLEHLEIVNHYRKKYCVSKRDALDMVERNESDY